MKIPDGWEEMKLSEILDTLENGNRPKGGIKKIENGVPSLGGEHLNSQGGFRLKNLKLIPNEFYHSLRRGKIKKEDVLVVKDGATTGKTSFVGKDFPYEESAVNEHVFILRGVKDRIEQKFLFYHLFSPFGQRQIDVNFHGAAIGGVNTQFAKNYSILIPPLSIQKKIVSILEKTEQLKQWRTESDKYTDDYLNSVFLEMFGDPKKNPYSWEIKRLDEIAKIKTGGTPSRKIKEFWEKGNIPWIKTTELKNDTIYDVEEFITEKGFKNSNVSILPKNSILIAMYGQGKTRGRTAKLNISSTINQACAAILPSDKYNTDFLWQLLKLSYENLRNLGRGGNQPNLNLNMIKKFQIYFPPMNLQGKFAEFVEKFEQMKKSQQQSKQQIDDLFNALMQKAFRGELNC